MPTEEPYLIAHKVRGEPALDIAIRVSDMSRDEDWWIIPTSGHRAYPYWFQTLDSILYDAGLAHGGVPSMPENWPDHDTPSYTRRKPPGEAGSAPTPISTQSALDLI